MNYQDKEYLNKWVDLMARFVGKRQLKAATSAEIYGFEFNVKNGNPVELSAEDSRTMKFKSIKLIFPKLDNNEVVA